MILDADYRPPVKRGDIDALLTARPRVIGIIDGQFFQNLAVSPKEILRALESGVAVFGAASMGALRAAELHRFGMVGLGKIFQHYKSGRIDADDEVAVVFAEDDGRAFSEPMINIRFALQGAVEEGIITLNEKRLLVRLAKSLYFPERSYPRLRELATGKLSQAQLSYLHEYLEWRAPNVKRADAVLLLSEIRRLTIVGATSRQHHQ